MSHAHFADLAWIILLLPLLSTVLITLITQRDPRLSAQLSIGATAVCFVLSLALFIFLNPGDPSAQAINASSFTWLAVGNFSVEFGLTLDPLSLLMILIVSGVAATIHLYSYGYMAGDRGFS